MVQKTSIFILTLCFLLAYNSYVQAERDTLFYELKTEMIDQANVYKMKMKEPQYFISVRLKKDYHAKYAQLTGDNIGNFFAVVYGGKIINLSLPTIQTAISGGRFSLGDYKEKEEAVKVKNQILNEDE